MRVLIVDDEAPARRKLLRFLRDAADVEVAGEATGVCEAVEAIRSASPDVVFLDVQMSDGDGFAVLEAIAQDAYVPAIIFVTAFDQYAIRAFDVCAVDYLLKPYDRERFERALDRARRDSARGAGSLPKHLRTLVDELTARRRYVDRLLVSGSERSFFVHTRDVARVEAARNYVVLHCNGRSHSMRGSLDALEQRLDPSQFVRINRSNVVRIDAIAELQPWFHGEHKVKLRDGTVLMWSRRYVARRPDLLATPL